MKDSKANGLVQTWVPVVHGGLTYLESRWLEAAPPSAPAAHVVH